MCIILVAVHHILNGKRYARNYAQWPAAVHGLSHRNERSQEMFQVHKIIILALDYDSISLIFQYLLIGGLNMIHAHL